MYEFANTPIFPLLYNDAVERKQKQNVSSARFQMQLRDQVLYGGIAVAAAVDASSFKHSSQWSQHRSGHPSRL